MDWPAYSPDLNPIKHVWDILGRRIEARQPPPTCLPEFRRALLDEWCNIPQDQIDKLILSMPRRFRRAAQLSSSSLDHGSKLSGLSPHKSPRVAEQCEVNIRSLSQQPENVLVVTFSQEEKIIDKASVI
ncbi:kinesin-like protein [Trichonephila clavipes]|nr:kinesin-like protein [Trichonephila clavipes]